MAAPRKLSAGVVVVRETTDGARMLLLRAYRNWDFPKEIVEPGEDPRAAAVRETAEETGIADLSFDWGDEYCETAPYSGNKVARYYIARTRAAAVTLGHSPELGRPEHHEYRWVDMSEALDLAAPRIEPVILWAVGKLVGAAARQQYLARDD
jgi:8-oxo-dGTP pyrophosphatase MutT (NUDIX family)